MKWMGIAALAATTVTCVLAGCGGSEDSRCAPGDGASCSERIGADAGTGDSGSSDAATTVDGSKAASGNGTTSGGGVAGSGSSGGSASGSGTGSGTGGASGPGVCAPAAACGGLYTCTDNCYSDKCCLLQCSCSDPSGLDGQLECALTGCTK